MITIHKPALIFLDKGTIDTRQELIDKLQLALMLEFSTIPLYLTALYSIKKKGSYAYQLIRSVVVEEMLHMNLVSNLILSIGAKPAFKSNPYFPRYPTMLPGQKEKNVDGPLLQLMPASLSLIENVFMVIEEPARRNAPPQEENYKTIAQFYLAILEGFKTVEKKLHEEGKSLFVPHPVQKTLYYFGSGGGNPLSVHDLKSAKKTIDEIVEQGEGAPATSGMPTEPNENYGMKDAYAYRSDGTYGPILDGTSEQSHYYKFMEVAKGNYPLGDVYPMLPNPSLDKFQANPWAALLADIFNGCYTIMVAGLEKAFGSTEEDDPFFSVVFTLMQSIIPVLSVQLMNLPVLPNGNAAVGPNAGPTFMLTETTLEELIDKVENAIRTPPSEEDVTKMKSTLTTVLKSLMAIHEKVKDKHYSFL